MRWSNSLARRGLKPFGLAICLIAGPLWADIAYVTCQNGEVLSIIDTDTGETRAWSLPGKPAGIAVAPEGIYTVSPDSKEVRRLDPRTGTVQSIAHLDGGPIGIALDAVRNRVFVSDWYNARIWVLTGDALELIQELEVGAAPAGLDLSDDGRFLASADRDANQVSVFDAETLALVGRFEVGTRPFGLRFAPDGRLFVGNVGTNDITILDPQRGPLATIAVGERPYGVTFAMGRAFVSNQYENTVSVIDLATLKHLAKIDVGEYPEGIDTASDGRTVLVANWFDNTLMALDAATLEVVGEWETGDGPRAFGDFLLGGKT